MPLGAMVLVAWLLLLVTPVAAGPAGPTRLADPSVTPRFGTTATTVAFSVVYRNREGSGPDWVRVVIDGVARDMHAADPDATAKTGTRFAYATRLPVGTHDVRFASRGRDRFEDALDVGTVRIVAAAPAGGTSGSGSGSSGTGGSTGSGGATSSGGTSGSGSGSSGTGGSTGSGGATSSGGTSGPSGDAPTGALGGRHELDTDAVAPAGTGGGPILTTGRPGVPRPESGPTAASGSEPGGPVAAGSGPGGSGPGGSGSGGSNPGLRLPGGSALSGDRIARLLPLTVVTSTVTTLGLAFLVFGKRRRDKEQPASDNELGLAAASPYASCSASDLAASTAIPAASLPPVPAFDPGTGGTDVDLPRWRRPSLLAARKSDPVRNAGTGVHLAFGGVPPEAAGTERRRIRYRIVRLLDRPDELLGLEIGTLDEGDEVAILEQHGTYRRVFTPDGRQGWLHRMTLGDVVVDGAPEAEPEVDSDVLLAFLAARARG